MGFRTVGEDELTEQALEVVTVVVRDVPEHSLEVTRTSGLVNRIYDLLEAVGNHLVDGAMFERHIDNFVSLFVVVGTELLLDKVVHIHQELGSCARTAQHTRNDEHQVYKATTE